MQSAKASRETWLSVRRRAPGQIAGADEERRTEGREAARAENVERQRCVPGDGVLVDQSERKGADARHGGL